MPRPLRLGSLAVVGCLTAAPDLAHAHAHATPPIAPVAAPVMPAARTWYGWQTLATDGASLALALAGSASGNGGLGRAGLGFYLFGAPLVHLAHGAFARGGVSFALRLGAPFAGASAGLVTGAVACRGDVEGEVHEQSARRAKPFVRLHCGALPDGLLESELFGYEKGAFTGAVGRKPGRVELAEGGTLFLDEIGDVTPAMQVKLLRVLQEREYERLGGTQTLRADVRFVAATHRDLGAMAARGEFREDLYYRLNVIPLAIPPLRARPDDVAALARRFARAHGPGVTIAPDALALLAAQRWPGNVRQLQNFVERLVVLSDRPAIGRADVERELARKIGPAEPPAGGPAPALSLDASVREAEKLALRGALEKARGNRALAARLLGVSRRTLYNKLDEYGLA